jgi:hypothetical protein
VSADYAMLLRPNAGQTVPVAFLYPAALSQIRRLTQDQRLTDVDLGAEVRLVLAAVERVQEELDALET